MASSAEPLNAATTHRQIRQLIDNLINIRDTTGEYLLRLPDGRTVDTKGWHDGWDWTHGIGLYGLWNYYTLTRSPDILAHITEWFAATGPFARAAEDSRSRNINTMAALLTLAKLCDAGVQAVEPLRPQLERWAEWAMHELPRTPLGGFQHITYDLRNERQLWADTLMMTALPLAAIGTLLRRPEYVEEARRQVLLHAQVLFDAQTGLWFHGFEFADEEDGSLALGHNFARARWARGNCWVTMAIPEFLELLDLPPGDGFRQHLVGLLEAQCRGLRAAQTTGGMWRTLLDVAEDEGSYVEASATAGFAYGILKAVRKGYVGGEYRDVGVRAVRAVADNINAEGELLRVSFGTSVGWDLQHYKDVPCTSMPYGQAMAIMALGEYLRSIE